VIVNHVDGRRFSVRVDDPRATGEDGWTVEGAETPDAFIVTGVPKPKPLRERPRPKNAAPIASGGTATLTVNEDGTAHISDVVGDIQIGATEHELGGED